jgi:hypothetical protein
LESTSTSVKSGRGRPSKSAKEKTIAAVKGTAKFTPTSKAKQLPPSISIKETATVIGNAKLLNPNVEIKIFQIYFRPEHKKKLDPHMVPFDNSRRKNHLLEYDVFRRLARSDETKSCDYWGAVSWKFPESMGFSGSTFKSFMAKNPGYDVYFCNPHPAIEGVYENLWVQGELSHPNFIELSSRFLKAAELDANAVRTVVPSGYIASANYFVANEKFWTLYLAFVDRALQKAEENLDSSVIATLLSPVADAKGLHNGANYVPFIVERLLTEFLLLHSKTLRAIKVQSPKLENKLSDHHKSLRALKDLATRSQSDWLLDCWRNYRNLLLSALAEPKALEPFVPVLTNKSVKFVDLQH